MVPVVQRWHCRHIRVRHGTYARPSEARRRPWPLQLLPLRRFTVLAYLKCFVGLCKDRLEGLMASPRATLAAHCRTLALLVLLLSYDVSWVVRRCQHPTNCNFLHMQVADLQAHFCAVSVDAVDYAAT